MRQKQFTTRMYGDAILERLKVLGMSKADLARTAEISESTLKRAIEGRSVHIHTIVAICHALGGRVWRGYRLLGDGLLQSEN